MKKANILVTTLLAVTLLSGCSATDTGERSDPLEGFNRTMWNFNYKLLDPYLFEPVAKGWRDYIPSPITTGLSNIADNLDEPVSFVNRLLEGDPQKAFVHFNRFWINTVFGLGGLFDIASASEPLRIDNQRGFGETLGTYGIEAGTYVVLPIYNATTPRQLTGDIVDVAYMYPFWNWVGSPWGWAKTVVQALETRAENLDNTELLHQAQDSYLTFREAYYQNLEFKVKDGNIDEQHNQLSDDILDEID